VDDERGDERSIRWWWSGEEEEEGEGFEHVIKLAILGLDDVARQSAVVVVWISFFFAAVPVVSSVWMQW